MINKIDEYFSKFMNQLVYVNLLESNDYIDKDIPLPVLEKDLLETFSDEDYSNIF